MTVISLYTWQFFKFPKLTYHMRYKGINITHVLMFKVRVEGMDLFYGFRLNIWI